MPLIRLLLRFYNLYLSPERDFARRVRDLVGFTPARLSIFRLAFAHKSNQRVDRSTGQHSANNNERLEYLGDAVLGTIVAEYLFKKYPDADEGFLTKMRSRIVKRKSLNAIGDQMGLDVFLTELNRVRLSSSMLGNAVEALCGAVYLERGYEGTKRFVIRRMLRPYIDVHTLETTDDNFKSQLLEFCQKNGKSVAYQLVEKFKRDRRDRFRVAVVVGGERVAEADDFNKKAAEQLASRRALTLLGAVDAAALPPEPKPKARPKAERKVKPERKSRKKPAAAATPAEAPRATAPEHETTTRRERAAQPADERPRRRATGLSRTLYHAARTAAVAVEIVEGLGAGASTSPQPVAEPAPRPAPPPSPVESAAPPKRRRRPVPLRLLTPMVNHAAALLAIEFGTAPAAQSPRPRDTAAEEPADDAWDDTPLELVVDAEPAAARRDDRPPRPDRPEGPARPRGKRRRDKYDWVVSRDWVDLAPPPSGRR